MRMAIGLPKELRNKTHNEPKNPYVLPRNFATVTCHKCGALGHNMRSCKGKITAYRAIPKDGNKVKKAKATNTNTKTKTKAKTKTKTKTKSKKTTIVTQIGSSSQGPPLTQLTQEYTLD